MPSPSKRRPLNFFHILNAKCDDDQSDYFAFHAFPLAIYTFPQALSCHLVLLVGITLKPNMISSSIPAVRTYHIPICLTSCRAANARTTYQASTCHSSHCNHCQRGRTIALKSCVINSCRLGSRLSFYFFEFALALDTHSGGKTNFIIISTLIGVRPVPHGLPFPKGTVIAARPCSARISPVSTPSDWSPHSTLTASSRSCRKRELSSPSSPLRIILLSWTEASHRSDPDRHSFSAKAADCASRLIKYPTDSVGGALGPRGIHPCTSLHEGVLHLDGYLFVIINMSLVAHGFHEAV
ncbi:hypothetical protein Hypma_013441 [Hypsizygus marmoreus]|uniref:Uncharacterized protein n=1 Tax=Hypsizygus marmoreus TaxID=39966 RepID=A0A369JBQ3_HYPMA|nr:hypothetical protein Hypma_013441 [Hypsizygus marmoreus]